jgi:hypothetical protein
VEVRTRQPRGEGVALKFQCRSKLRKNGARYWKDKVRYDSFDSADEVAVWMRKKWRTDYQPYRCTECGHWHVGRMPSNGLPASRYWTRENKTLLLELGPRAFTHFVPSDSLGKIKHLFDTIERRST